MGCTNCAEKPEGCGCEQEALHISQICNPVSCPVEECSETFKAACIIYTGEDIICNNVILATSGENIAQIAANISAYFCEQTTIDTAILCGITEVVPEGTTVKDSISLIVAYFCDQSTIDTQILCGVDEVVPANTLVKDALSLIVAYFCEAIENISLTPGPQGDQGIQGIQGVQGVPGNDGADGSNIGLGSIIDSTGIAQNTTTPTSLVGSLSGTLDIAAGTMVVGDTFQLRASGNIGIAASTDLTMDITLGGVVIGTYVLANFTLISNRTWEINAVFTVRSIGVTGSVVLNGQLNYYKVGSDIDTNSMNNGVVVIDTTVLNTIDLIATWGTASPASTIDTEILVLTKIK